LKRERRPVGHVLADRLLEANESARSIFGADYERAAEPWRAFVRERMADWKCSAVEVAPRLHRELKLPPNPLLLIAAIVDVVESEKP
jgi:hypothetical protein